jgi:tetratricopeptide (TPR) repeat protein
MGSDGAGSAPGAYYNPSALVLAGADNAACSTFKLFDGSMYNFAGSSIFIGGDGAMALSVINLRTGGIEARQNIDDVPRSADTNQLAFFTSYARRFPGLWGLNAGVNLKYVSINIYGSSGADIGADLGLSKEFKGPEILDRKSRVFAGVSCQNVLQPKFKLISDEEVYGRVLSIQTAFSMPLSFIREGPDKLLYFDKLSIMADAVAGESETEPKFGAEYCALNKYTLRAGYYPGHATAGAGFRYGDLQLDYAADFSNFTVFHRIGLEFYWGKRGQLMREAIVKSEEDRRGRLAVEKNFPPEMKAIQKECREKCFLAATERLKNVMLRYPDYAPAKELYEMITSQMSENAKGGGEPDFEEISYAKGYNNYFKQNFENAVNEWGKVIQIDPERKEVTDYTVKVKSYLADMNSRRKEKELEESISKQFEEAVKYFDSAKWVQCIKRMEKIKKTCETGSFAGSFEWHEKSDAYIKNAVDEIARNLPRKSEKPAEEKDTEVYLRSAEKKYGEGLLLYAQGKLSGAAQMWEIALRFNPSHEKAKAAFEKVKQELSEAKTIER